MYRLAARPFGALALLLLALAACSDATGPAGGDDDLTAAVRDAARPLSGTAADYDPLFAAIGESRFVMLGEASHGSHEFYRERARISRRLAAEKGFAAVAVEGEWPAARRVDRYVRGGGADATPEAALSGFTDFPRWMWRNAAVRDFVRELRADNEARSAGSRTAFYGLDLYSLYESIDEVVGYLAQVDPQAAERARARYACFARYGRSAEAYADAVARDPAVGCATQAADQLAEMLQRSSAPGARADEELFSAEQNARVVRNAEEFYRSQYGGGTTSSWNVRDRHMAETLDALTAHLQARGRPGRVVVWAHNTHVGDARATDMGKGGDWNVGQLVREKHGTGAFLVGFTTYAGTVTAAWNWGDPAQRREVRTALSGSFEDAFHRTGVPSFLLVLRGAPVAEPLRGSRLERAIGVVYRPDTERTSHYFGARLSEQFDAVVHLDQTGAVEPLS